MCGIAGFIGQESIDQNLIDDTLFLMRKRGPDSQNFEILSDTNSPSALNVADPTLVSTPAPLIHR